MSKSAMPAGFDWLTTLEALSKNGRISNDRASELQGLAGQWPTCACGQLCTLLDREHDGSPMDDKLKGLGVCFLTYVTERRWCVALETFKKIERRTTKLLKEQLSEDVCPVNASVY